MMEEMDILKKVMIVEYSTNYLDPESARNLYLASLAAELLAIKGGFRWKSLEFYCALNSCPY